MRVAATILFIALVAADAPAPGTRQFRFLRRVNVPAGSAPVACAVLDATTYAHAGASLDDVRLFSGGAEVPYALTMSNTSYLSAAGERARVLNLGVRGRDVEFDLAMPSRAYTAVDLDLRGENFVATAKVTGAAAAGKEGTNLGTFTLFDLSAKRLGRDTELRLAETSFAYLHVDLQVNAVYSASAAGLRASPAMVAGASVPPSREAQTLYTEVARSEQLEQVGTRTEARLQIPARVPVERVRFEVKENDRTNFSRSVMITAHPEGAPAREQEEITGEIARVHLEEEGSQLRRDDLSTAATLGANARQPAEVKVAIENGDDRALPLSAVDLEMRQRKLCFRVPTGAVVMLYGAAGLKAPRYDFSRIFEPAEETRAATLGPEEANPGFVAPVERAGLIERHPQIVWVALLALLGVLGWVALRSGASVGKGKP